MPVAASEQKMSYTDRVEALRNAKRAQTFEKQLVRGSMDFDDHGIVLPPDGQYRVVHSMSGSGIEINDAILTTFIPSGNNPSGEFFGARA